MKKLETYKTRYIRVPFKDKDRAKALGARWDAALKCWFVPQGVDPIELRKWWAYLECPYEEKDEARSRGANWDKILKLWFVPFCKDFDDFSEWWPAWVRERVALGSSVVEEPKWHFVDGQLGGRYAFMFSEEYSRAGGTAKVFFGWRVDSETHAVEESYLPTVAIKFFFTDESSIDYTMFDREVATLKMLRGHPNIVSLIDYGFDPSDRTFFAVTEYQQHSLGELMSACHSGQLKFLGINVDVSNEINDERQRLDDEKLSSAEQWLEDFELFESILNGLVHALAAGIYHRDLKPDNILISTDEETDELSVKLCDFGIASNPEAVSGAATLKNIGTKLYHPGSECEDDYPGARDVYSWGVIAIEALSDEILTTKTEIRNALYNELKSKIPSTIAEILERCIDEDPSKRPKNVKVLLDELKNANARLE